MRETIANLLREALSEAISGGDLALDGVPEITLERPRDPAHGDWATNVAMRSAKEAGKPPREVAEAIVRRLSGHPDIAEVDVAGPGFINLRLSPQALQRVVRDVRAHAETYGNIDLGGGHRVQVEFVSANPVGPLHIGHGRWAALGDSIARLLAAAGYAVQREFYVNDAGVQMDIFAKSVAARYLELTGHDVEFPEDGYRGAYIADIAREILADEGESWAEASAEAREAHFKERAYTQVLQHLQHVLHRMGVDFDVWFSERTLHAPGADGEPSAIERGIQRLREAGYVYEHEGAVWFRATDFGDDKDRVLTKADGEYTYFAADVAYHADKFDRGFDLVIDLWGADHHGYVKRMEAAAAALGHPGQLELVIGQLVNLFRNGEVVRMSKRTGEMVTFEELLEEVGADASRYFFLRRSTDQSLDFDIGLAKEQSSENPVYYVQYAHARICSILRKAARERSTAESSADGDGGMSALAIALAPVDTELTTLDTEGDLALIRRLAEFPDIVEVGALQRAPHKLTRYAEELAATFHQFYTVCRVVSEDDALTKARLALVDATRIVLERALDLVGVSAPERM